ncbi:MAG TPA: acylphosphatase [Actinomycetales bacterium]|nr:acylphosphatase [Actinomycetales bacterium]
MQTRAVEVKVSGRVQGVFFRATCADEAERLGVRGWVGNEPDGTVAGHFEGPTDAVEALIAWCRSGPPRARVEAVEMSEAQATGSTGFAAR